MLLPNSISGFSAAPSTSRAPDRRAFHPLNEQNIHTEDASASPSTIHPYGAKAVRVSQYIPALQALRVQSRLNPVTEVAKIGVCADRHTSIGRMMPECDSSGTDHDPSSVCLVAMVNEFIESESVCGGRADSGNFFEEAMFNGLADISNSLQSLALSRDDLEIKLLRDVQAIVESSQKDHQSGCVRTDQTRLVVNALQRIGYDAAICETRWDHSNGLPGGFYEYIDVLFALASPREPSRLLVDIKFQAQFEIARPSSEFSAVLQLVPPIFVGRSERLQQIVPLMAEASKQSLRVTGLHLPPWRKLSYMKAKWFSSYKRKSNHVANNSRKQNGSINGGGFTGISVRGYGLDPRCTNELELLYHSSQLRRGVCKDAISCSNARDELITVTATNWQPPPREVRSHSNGRSQISNVTGLASMQLHVGLPTCNEVVAKAA